MENEEKLKDKIDFDKPLDTNYPSHSWSFGKIVIFSFIILMYLHNLIFFNSFFFIHYEYFSFVLKFKNGI